MLGNKVCYGYNMIQGGREGMREGGDEGGRGRGRELLFWACLLFVICSMVGVLVGFFTGC